MSRNKREGYYWGVEKMYESKYNYHNWKLCWKGHMRGNRGASLKTLAKARVK